MEYTPEEIVQFTINILNQVKVPMAYYQDISDPIQKCIVNLTVAKQMLEVERVKQEAENDPVEVKEDEREADSE